MCSSDLASQIPVESAILTKTVVVQFFPNSSDLYKKVEKRNSDGSTGEGLYDPNVDFVVEEIAKVSKQYGAARIVIEGHTDRRKFSTNGDYGNWELSTERGNAARRLLLSGLDRGDASPLEPNPAIGTIMAP